MRKTIFIAIIAILVSCQSTTGEKQTQTTQQEVVLRGEAQGTTYTIKYIGEEQEGLKTDIDTLLRAIDLSLSTYLPNSTISQFNDGDTVRIDSMFQRMYELSRNINVATGGAFNPTIGPLIKAWGFDFSDPQRLDSSDVKELLQSSGFSKFKFRNGQMWKLDERARINFNAIAQGYSVDLMAGVLNKRGIENYYVEIGGELKVKGRNKRNQWWIIGIDKPIDENTERTLATKISLENAAMATSGNYRKYYEVDGKRYSHTLNPITGYPAKNNLLSATVVADNCALADAMATAFMVMGLENAKVFLKGHENVEAHLIFADEKGGYGTYTSEGLKEKMIED